MTDLRIVPTNLREAHALVAEYHRHNRPARGGIVAIGLARGDELVGAAVLGRPTAAALQDGMTAEVTRVAVIDGVPNGCSMLLYGAAWRVAKGLGYRRLVTYTRGDESGSSLRAAGWRIVNERAPRAGWDTPARRRASDYEPVLRLRWEA